MKNTTGGKETIFKWWAFGLLMGVLVTSIVYELRPA